MPEGSVSRNLLCQTTRNTSYECCMQHSAQTYLHCSAATVVHSSVACEVSQIEYFLCLETNRGRMDTQTGPSQVLPSLAIQQ